jgi:hypothetical protein
MYRLLINYRAALIASLLLLMPPVSGCGGGDMPQTGCYVNGFYYANGTNGQGLCSCLLPGPCIISHPGPDAISGSALDRHGYTGTQLSDGTILVTGGKDNYGTVLDTAELVDPATRRWTAVVAKMISPRVRQ